MCCNADDPFWPKIVSLPRPPLADSTPYFNQLLGGTLSTTGTVILDIIVTSCNGGGFSLDLFLDYLLSYVVSSPPLYNCNDLCVAMTMF